MMSDSSTSVPPKSSNNFDALVPFLTDIGLDINNFSAFVTVLSQYASSPDELLLLDAGDWNDLKRKFAHIFHEPKYLLREYCENGSQLLPEKFQLNLPLQDDFFTVPHNQARPDKQLF